MKMFIQALELEMTPEEIRAKIPPEKLTALKGKGVLQAYTAAHVGQSRPKVLGEGVKTIQWTKAAVQRLAQKIKSGTKFFVGHGEDNSHKGRKEVGEVLTSFVRDISGRLSGVVIGHFPDKSSVAEMDVCSVEADVDVDKDNYYVDDVNEVSAIALGASAIDNPAFPGAVRLASVQCFDEPENTHPERDTKMEVTFRDVQDFIKERNVFPHQLYNADDLRNDREFNQLFESSKELEDKNKALQKELEDTKKLFGESESKVKLSTAKERFQSLIPENLTEKQKTFILNRFKPESIVELSDEDVKAYIENEKKDFAETAKLFGVTDSSQSEKSASGIDTGVTGDGGESTPEEQALKIVGVG